jgi:hypothetical protein
MLNSSHVALALVVGGLVCILASMGAVMYLYHEHAAQLIPEDPRHPEVNLPFLLFVGIPALAVFTSGVVSLAIGIKKL